MVRRGPPLPLALVGFLALITACGITQDPSPEVSLAHSASPSANSAEASAEIASIPASAAAASTVELAVPVPFTFTAPGDWKQEELITGSTTRGFRSGIDQYVVFTELGPDTVEGWIAGLTSNESLTVSEPSVVELDGAPGLSVDLRLSDGAQEAILFREGWGDWNVAPGRPNRVWVTEVGGEVVAILADAPEATFDEWVATVEEVLSTVDWSE
jgi:hypothetical protein